MTVFYNGTLPDPFAVAQAVYQFETAQPFIAPMVAPAIEALEKNGTIPKVSRRGLMATNKSLQRGVGATYKRGEIETEGGTFECIGYGYEHKVPVETQRFWANKFNAIVAGAEFAKGELLVGREKRVADLIFNTTTWTGSDLYTDYSGAPWDAAASDVIGQIQTVKEKVRANTGMAANAVIMSEVNRVRLMSNTDIRAALAYTKVPTIAEIDAALAALFGVEKVIIGKAVYNSANNADTATASDIWSDDYAMVAKVCMTNDPNENGLARLITWNAMGAGTDVMLDFYYEPQTKSDIIQCDLYEDEIVIDTYCGHLIKVDA